MQLLAVDYLAPDADKQFVDQNWQAFFNSDEKLHYAFDNKSHDGFFSTKVSETAKGFKKKDIKEYFHYYPWGKCPPNLKQELQDYYQAANDLASELLGWVEKYSPADVAAHYSEPLSGMATNSDQTLLRLKVPVMNGLMYLATLVI